MGSAILETMKVPIARPKQKGFTLLEFLIALTLSALLFGVIALASSTVSNEWDRQNELLEQDVEQSLAFLRLERSLQGMFPFQYKPLGENIVRTLIEGADETLVWASTQSPGMTGSLSVWRLRNDDDGILLDRADLAGGYDEETMAWSDPVKLEGFAAVRMKYAAYSPVDRNLEWRDSWPPEEPGEMAGQLPRAVWLSFYLEDKVALEKRGDRDLIAVVKAFKPHGEIR